MWVQNLTSLLSDCVTLGRLSYLRVPQFPHLELGLLK